VSLTGLFCGLVWGLGTGHVLFLVKHYQDLWFEDYKRRERAEAKRLGLPEPEFGMLFE